MPVTGKTRPFGAGPFGFAAFGTWRREAAGAGVAVAQSASIGAAVNPKAGAGVAIAASAAAGGPIRDRISGALAVATSDAQGWVAKDLIAAGISLPLSDAWGVLHATRGVFGRVPGQSFARGRLRLLWDRPDDPPEVPLWGPVAPGSSGPWQPIPMPGAPAWQPQQPAEI